MQAAYIKAPFEVGIREVPLMEVEPDADRQTDGGASTKPRLGR
ncbi:MAG: hypothetical protein K0Q94_1261 [Paenibacillus sp.]|jgi:hypothetical protein|nr:hypothetical protein [Paenibacillus sp.]